jgi:hypothetical protein
MSELTCGLCKRAIYGDERYTVDHYKCSADLHQSFRNDIESIKRERDDLIADLRRLVSWLHDEDVALEFRADYNSIADKIESSIAGQGW